MNCHLLSLFVTLLSLVTCDQDYKPISEVSSLYFSAFHKTISHYRQPRNQAQYLQTDPRLAESPVELILCKNLKDRPLGNGSWSCSSKTLPSHMKLANAEVFCEGPDYPYNPLNPLVYEDSCWLEYSLELDAPQVEEEDDRSMYNLQIEMGDLTQSGILYRSDNSDQLFIVHVPRFSPENGKPIFQLSMFDSTGSLVFAAAQSNDRLVFSQFNTILGYFYRTSTGGELYTPYKELFATLKLSPDNQSFFIRDVKHNRLLASARYLPLSVKNNGLFGYLKNSAVNFVKSTIQMKKSQNIHTWKLQAYDETVMERRILALTTMALQLQGKSQEGQDL